MNCPHCGAQSKYRSNAKVRRNGSRLEHQEYAYRQCPKCKSRWTEFRRILVDTVRRHNDPLLRG